MAPRPLPSPSPHPTIAHYNGTQQWHHVHCTLQWHTGATSHRPPPLLEVRTPIAIAIWEKKATRAKHEQNSQDVSERLSGKYHRLDKYKKYNLAQATHAHHHWKTTPTPVSANPCTTYVRSYKAPNIVSNKDKTKRATNTQRRNTNTDKHEKKTAQRKAFCSEHCNKSLVAMIIKHVPVDQNRRHKRGTSEIPTIN